MSLLDDVSIVVTPNGYKAGELYAVIPVPSEGAELLTNGDFASDLTGWTGYGTRSATGGIATIGASANSGIYQGILTEGFTYTVTVNVTSYDGVGTAELTNNNGNNIYTITETGIQTFTFIHTISSSNLIIRGMSNAVFSLSSVSVKEYTVADMDVTRATAATRVDEDGLIADVLSGVPRIDYTGGGCPHILAEPARTNLATYSEAYGSGTFFSAHSGTTIDSTTETSPDGENAATEITSTGDGKLQSGGLSLTQNTDYVLSFYAKNVDATLVNSRVYATGGSGGSNLTSVNYTSQLSTTEWTRITHSFNTGTNTAIYVYLSSALNSGGTIQVWGAQLEQGSYATSYIPNFGTSSGVTRAQDVFSRDGIGSLIGQTEGTFFVELSKPVLNPDSYYLISLNNAASNSANNSVTIGFESGSDDFFLRFKAGGSNIFVDSGRASSANTFYKIAISYKSSESLIYIDGSSITPNSGSLGSAFTFNATLDNLSFDHNGNNTYPFFGNVRQLQVYDTALSPTQLAALTS
jgi:hypothetical protein